MPSRTLTLTNILLDARLEVHLVGEASSRSFSIALAALRGGFDGVYASHYSLEAARFGPSFYECRGFFKAIDSVEQVARQGAITSRQESGMSRFSRFAMPFTHIIFLLTVRRSSVLRSEFAASGSETIVRLSNEADARCLDDFYYAHPEVPTTVIFFQCPWYQGKKTADLIKDLITSASWVQSPGEVLVIGLCTPRKYVVQYGWAKALQVAFESGYQVRARDVILVNRCFRRGYKHTAYAGNVDLENNNCAWVFRK